MYRFEAFYDIMHNEWFYIEKIVLSLTMWDSCMLFKTNSTNHGERVKNLTKSQIELNINYPRVLLWHSILFVWI